MKGQTKLQLLLKEYPVGVPLLTAGLRAKNGMYQYFYALKRQQWLEDLGYGAYMRKGDKASLFGCLYALEIYTKAPIHIGGIWAIILQDHQIDWSFIPYEKSPFRADGLYAPRGYKWPKWFKKIRLDFERKMGKKIQWRRSQFLAKNYGFTHYKFPGRPAMRIRISNPPRALLEALYYAYEHAHLLEIYDLMNRMKWLSATYCQRLLETCNSYRVRRYFLALSAYAEGPWLEKMDLKRIPLGTSVYPKPKEVGFAYCKKHKLFLPLEIVAQDYM